MSHPDPIAPDPPVTDGNQKRSEAKRTASRLAFLRAHAPARARARLAEGEPETGDSPQPAGRRPPEALRRTIGHLTGDRDRLWPADAPDPAALLRYAEHGQQLSSGSPLRGAAVAWCRAVAIPQAASHYARAWMWQRPGRAGFVLSAVALIVWFVPWSIPVFGLGLLAGFLL